MITGYNTDTKHDGVVYHVQTEDGGVENPYVVTLVYRGGRILASKKTGYAELLGTPDLVNRLRAILDKQHRLMMAAVNAGMLAEGGRLEAKAAAALQRDGLAPPAPGPAPAGLNPPKPAQPVAAAPACHRPFPVAPPPQPPPPGGPGSPKPSHDEKSLDQVILEFLASELGKK
jgi:hypothetical protein